IITIGPYQPEVYSAFGHSGILVRDASKKINRFYNYGLYDFEQENFFLNFAFGLLKYKVGVNDYRRVFYYHTSVQNRFVKEQFLNLTLEEKQRFFDFLEENIKPENAEYIYNYVYNNCATKLPEVIDQLFPGRVMYDFSYKVEEKSVRDLMDDYLGFQPWGDFGIDLGLGQQIDKEADERTYLFLPDYVHYALEKATIKRDSVEVPFVSDSRVYPAPKEEKLKNGVMTPFNVFVVLFFVVGFITNRDFKRRKRTRWIDTALFSFAGFIGLWVAFLWFGTDHLSKWNLNIFWALPTHIVVIFLSKKGKLKPFVKNYFKFTGIWYLILLLIWAILPQPLHMSLVPLVLTMVLRALYLSYDLKGK
ncbi:MAG: DUF4105 domain-containing protein, partial [Bacteroidota bacterium]